jgi:hypothetical protein
MWHIGSPAEIGFRKVSSVLGGGGVFQWIQPRHQVLRNHFKSILRYLRDFIEDGDYTKSAAAQLSEDSEIFDRILRELEALAESLRDSGDVDAVSSDSKLEPMDGGCPPTVVKNDM